MPTIELETTIQSSLEICFDLSRSIDLHQVSTAHTNEKAIDGKITGLIGLNEFVTWRATHFGITQNLSSVITAFDSPVHFRDEQLKGIFKYIVHDHYFKAAGNVVIMKDVFRFGSPLGFIGRILDKIILTAYLKKLLLKRNAIIREYAESGKWKDILNGA